MLHSTASLVEPYRVIRRMSITSIHSLPVAHMCVQVSSSSNCGSKWFIRPLSGHRCSNRVHEAAEESLY